MPTKISEFLMEQLVHSWAHWYDINPMCDELSPDTPDSELCMLMKGNYYCENDDGTFTACANEDLCCWVEDFGTESKCIDWLEGYIDAEGNEIPYAREVN